MACSDAHIGMHSFIEVDGLEIANGARTIEYIRRGLAGGYWSATAGCSCSVLWRELGCETAEECFVSPAADPAPWYDPATPASGEFLGLLIPDLKAWFDGQAARSTVARASGLGGASLGPLAPTPRALPTSGVLVAASCRGLEYGRRWIQNVLSRLCDPCALSVARVYASCPPCDGSDDSEGEWFVYDVGIVEGLKRVAAPDYCERLPVEFTLLAGNPYLYGRPEPCLPETSLNPEACAPECIDFCHWLTDAPPAAFCTVAPPALGVLGTVITIRAGVGLHNLTIETLTDCADSAATGTVTGSIIVPELPAGSTLVIDSALRKITFTGADGVSIDGTGFLELPYGFGVPWLEIGDCNPAGCISAGLARICDSDCTSTVQIDVRLREG